MANIEKHALSIQFHFNICVKLKNESLNILIEKFSLEKSYKKLGLTSITHASMILS